MCVCASDYKGRGELLAGKQQKKGEFLFSLSLILSHFLSPQMCLRARSRHPQTRMEVSNPPW